jgi:hypothetical protein
MARPQHPDKHIETAVAYAEIKGWKYVHSNGHAWGRLLCGHNQQGGCQMSVWSTPRNTVAHAKQILRRSKEVSPLAKR